MMGRTSFSCLWLALTTSLAACSFSDSLAHCTSKTQCKPSEECYQGFCIAADTSTKNPIQDPTRNDAGATTTPTTPRRDAGDMISTPPVMTSDAAADSGSDAAMDAAQDAHVDAAPAIDAGPGCEQGETRPCMLGVVTSTTAPGCNRGFTRCENNVFGACIADVMASAEQCNGLDDDCDGNADEGTDTVCYPEGQTGCTLSADNTKATCQGLCALGKRLCRSGKLQACTGAVLPQKESCDSSGGLAADENCDGAIDEGCACTGAQLRACYTGPTGTNGMGKCKAGTQSCNNGVLGACMGAVMPEAETCDNPGVDDDCNQIVDDIKDNNAVCSVNTNMGICRAGTQQCQTGSPNLVCVTAAPVVTELCNDLDDDCDGKTDEIFMLQTDPNHCGSCGKACGAGEVCCGGQCSNPNTDINNCGGCGATHVCAGGPGSCCGAKCVDFMADAANCGACGRTCNNTEACCAGKCVSTNTDINNCGKCGMVCSAGTQPACCGGSCADLMSNTHCGSCDHACGLLPGSVDPITCTCAVMNGVTQCVTAALAICI